jgi:hypothetical protein
MPDPSEPRPPDPTPPEPTPDETDRVLADLKAQIVQLRERVAAEWRRARRPAPDREPPER